MILVRLEIRPEDGIIPWWGTVLASVGDDGEWRVQKPKEGGGSHLGSRLSERSLWQPPTSVFDRHVGVLAGMDLSSKGGKRVAR